MADQPDKKELWRLPKAQGSYTDNPVIHMRPAARGVLTHFPALWRRRQSAGGFYVESGWPGADGENIYLAFLANL
jgi:hypothetical protein